jgi:hypothetical protein
MLEYWPQEFVLCNHNPNIVVKHLGGLYNFLKTVSLWTLLLISNVSVYNPPFGEI